MVLVHMQERRNKNREIKRKKKEMRKKSLTSQTALFLGRQFPQQSEIETKN